MTTFFYFLFGFVFCIFITSGIQISEAQSGTSLEWGSPDVFLEESENIVLFDSSQSREGPIKVLAKSKNPTESNVIWVWLNEYKFTGYFTGQVKFTAGDNNGGLNQVHANPGDQIIVKIPRTSLKDTGEVLSTASVNQVFGDMRFDTGFADCDLDFGGDMDGDGICADWETGNELVVNYVGSETYNYPCNPACDDTIKDIFLEIDWMQGHRPTQFAIDNIVQAYALSGVNDAQGNPAGIRLHIQIDDDDSKNIPHNNETFFPGDPDDKGFDQIKGEWVGTETERSVPGWNETGWNNKRQAFHYALFVHNQEGTTESGAAEVFGNDIIVSLGNYPGNIGTVYDQEGTLMHEIGHNLNLEHGGEDLINCKPNYLSVMSYSRQTDDFLVNRALDFSKEVLGTMSGDPTTLDENALIGNDGIGFYPPKVNDKIIYNNTNNAIKKKIVGSSCLNWNPGLECESTERIQDDTNTIRASDGVLLCYEPELTPLEGFDDWSNLAYGFRGSGGYDNGSPGSPTGSGIEPEHKCPTIKVAVPSHSAAAHKFRECAGGAGGEDKTLRETSEMTYEDVKTIRVILIDQLEDTIKNLPETSFGPTDEMESIEQQTKGYVPNHKAKYINEFTSVFKNAKEKVRNDNLRGAIDDISKLRKSFDDRIIGPEKTFVKGDANGLIDRYVQVLNIRDPSIEKSPGPTRQIELGIPYQDVQCNIGLSLMVNESLEDAICVTKYTGIYLNSIEKWKDYKFDSSEKVILE